MIKNIVTTLMFVSILACKEGPEQASRIKSDVVNTPRNKMIDSVELYIFPDPTDQKHFVRHATADTALIHLLVQNLHSPSIVASPCGHYKKLYLFQKHEVFKTIYISDTCGYIAYANNSSQVYKKLDNSLRNRLDSIASTP